MGNPNGHPVYLSPHLDDAALSCGGLISQQAEQGKRPTVITCFAGVPDYAELSLFAADQHKKWGEPEDPIQHRRQEDAEVMRCLGADYQHWTYLDCIYRRHPESGEFLYTSEAALFGQLHSAEHYLCSEVVARLSTMFSMQDTEVYAPLAVGHHVDHRLVLLAALRLEGRGFSICYYEDFPYALDGEKLDLALREWADAPAPTIRHLRPSDVANKVSAIRRYRSQLAVLFEGETNVESAVESYALRAGGGDRFGEKYWQGGRM